MKPTYKLGDKVTVSAILEKDRTNNSGLYASETCFNSKPISPVEGVYIGYRTALIGTVRYGEDGAQFRAKGSVRYYLVVTSDRQNPIKADPLFTK